MSILWLLLVILSVLYALFTGHSESILSSISDTADTSIKLCISLCGIFAVWSGILEVARHAGVLSALTKFLNPLIRKLFPGAKNSDTIEAISTNITADVLGMGNAATPAGQKAIKELNKNNPDNKNATSDMTMLLILNNSALTLIPTTILTLRATAGSIDPGIILPYALISSLASTLIAIILGKIFK